MAANRFATMLHRSTNRLAFLLIYTMLEWILIALLLLNAIFSYLIAKFASFFGLNPPCILCARVDHLFEPGKGQSSYRDLLCEYHSGEVSKLGFCSKHRRLSDAGGMCEGCAASIPGEADQNVDLPSWVKRSGQEEKNPPCSCCGVVLEGGFYSSYSLIKAEPWDVLECALKDGSVKVDLEEEKDGAHGPEEVEHGRDILPSHSAEIKEKEGKGEEGEDHEGEISLPTPRYFVADASVEIFVPPLVKIADEERRIPIELIDSSTMMAFLPRGFEANDILLQKSHSAEQGSAQNNIGEIAVKQTSVALIRDYINQTAGVLLAVSPLPSNEPSEDVPIDGHPIIPPETTDVEPVGTKYVVSPLPTNEPGEDAISPLPSNEPGEDAISPLPSNEPGEDAIYPLPSNEPGEDAISPLPSNEPGEDAISPLPSNEPGEDAISPLPSNEPCEDVPVDGLSIIPQEADDVGLVATKNAVSSLPTSELYEDAVSPLPTNDPFEDVPIDGHSIILQEATDAGLFATKIAKAFEVQQEGSKVNEEVNCEISIGSDIGDQEHTHHTQIHQSDPDPELIPDQGTIDCDPVTEIEPKRSSRQVNHLAVTPIIYDILEEGMPETPSTPYFIEGFPVLPKRFLLERRESGTESLDGSITSDLESMEPLTLDRLKTALKAERKSLTALYTELEEERSASAIAANQTMAMITRLQEEKAAMQMEALQYQRMMEEQSEYDQEALQLLNELVMRREREKQELERELDQYREKVLMYETREKRKDEISSGLEENDVLSFESHDGEESNFSPHVSNKNTPSACFLSYMNDPDTLDGDMTEFEENGLSIFDQIKSLEEKLFKIDDEDETSDTEYAKHLQDTESTKHCGFENGHGVDEESKFLDDDLIGRSPNGSLHDRHINGKLHCEQRNVGIKRKNLLPLFDAIENESKLSPKYDSVVGTSPDSVKNLDIVEEVDQVYQRLQALETDRVFLKHCISSLKNGEKWVNLLQEILRNLHGLRRLQFHTRSSDE